MFTNKTVFVLGAGASRHYGYPTGEELVQEVLAKCIRASGYFDQLAAEASPSSRLPQIVADRTQDAHLTHIRATAQDCAKECRDLADRLRLVNPPVIDYFLGQNRDLQEMGRVLIAWSILEREAFYEATQTRADSEKFQEFMSTDWCRFLLDRLVRGCRNSKSLLENQTTFVTFNYDVSLERRIYRGLRAISQFEDSDVRSFVDYPRFLHVYGKVAQDPLAPAPLQRSNLNLHRWAYEVFQNDQQRDWLGTLNAAYAAARSIRTIDPTDKGLDEETISKARAAIADADVVYILGFAFDPSNCDRLNLSQSLCEGRGKAKVVCYTNFRDVRNVDRAAYRLFYATEYPHDSILKKYRRPTHSFVYEKSSGDCYSALQSDFGTPEVNLLAGSLI